MSPASASEALLRVRIRAAVDLLGHCPSCRITPRATKPVLPVARSCAASGEPRTPSGRERLPHGLVERLFVLWGQSQAHRDRTGRGALGGAHCTVDRGRKLRSESLQLPE